MKNKTYGVIDTFRENLDNLMHKFTVHVLCAISQRQVGNGISLSKLGPLKTMTHCDSRKSTTYFKTNFAHLCTLLLLKKNCNLFYVIRIEQSL